jgi:polyisoprenoid-binding protein YceI
MKNLAVLIFLGLLNSLNPLYAQKQWEVLNSSATFKIKNAGFTVKGKFGIVKSIIIFDADNLNNSSIDANLEANTINTGIESRDSHLRKKDYFDTNKYPKINLKSKEIAKSVNGTYKGIFMLTMKGITKEVDIPFSYIQNGDLATFSGEFKINRLDFNVGGNSWVMSNDVTIKIVVAVSLVKK